MLVWSILYKYLFAFWPQVGSTHLQQIINFYPLHFAALLWRTTPPSLLGCFSLLALLWFTVVCKQLNNHVTLCDKINAPIKMSKVEGPLTFTITMEASTKFFEKKLELLHEHSCLLSHVVNHQAFSASYHPPLFSKAKPEREINCITNTTYVP